MFDPCLEALAALVAERLQHRDDDTFLTSADLAERYGCDVRAARDIARRAGAIKLGQGYQVRLDHLRAWEDGEAERGRDVPALRPGTSRRETMRGVSPAKPNPLPPLEPGWWRED